jgi:hypothetical protein
MDTIHSHPDTFPANPREPLTPFEPSATYLGCWDMRNEMELAESHRRIIHMFNLVRPLGVHPVGSTVTAETLRELGVVVPEDLNGWEKGREV